MKHFILTALFCMFTCSISAQVQQDIVFKSRFDLESSQSFINELRVFLRNNKFGDPYSQEFKKPLVFNVSELMQDLPGNTQDWLRELQSVLSFKLLESDYKIIIEKLDYSIKDFNSEIKAGDPTKQRVEYVTVNYVNGLRLKASKIIFEVSLKQVRGQEPLRFNIELIRPEFIVNHDVMAELSMGWATSIQENNILLTLESVDVSKIMKYVVKHPDVIDLKMEDVLIPDVSIKVGNKEVKFDHEKIKRFFVKSNESMKRSVLDLLNEETKERFENIISDSPKTLLLPRTYGFETDIKAVMDVQMTEVNNTGIVQVDLDGYFKDSHDQKIDSKLRRKIEIPNYRRSLREMNRSLIEKKTNIALSVSEDYINQLIVSTVEAGLWENSMKGKDFSLGPEKSFILADEKGELFSLYLDIIYRLSNVQKLLVGKSTLRFPIKFMIALNIREVDGIPRFQIKVKKTVTDKKLVLEGAPEYGLTSTVGRVPRFRAKILKEIMSEVATFQDDILVDLELSELKGTYLDQLKFFSDGLGRGTATIGFKK